MAGNKYSLSITPKGYKTDISADLLPSVTSGQWLTNGTQNVIIDEDGSITSRKGSTLLGEAGTDGGVKWADTWITSTNTDRPMRSIFDTLQVYYESEWYDVRRGFGNDTYFCGDSWWDRNQLMDRYVWANKTTSLYSWQGGISRVESRVSGTSLKKTNGGTPTGKSVLIDAGDTITWGYPVDAQNPTTYNAIRGGDGIENFWEEEFRAGDTISVTITAIAGTYTIASVNSQTNEILITGNFGSSGTSSAVGQGVVGTVNAYGPLAKTFAQERFGTPQFLGTATMTIATPCVVTYAAHGLVAGDMVWFETTGALPTGLTASTHYYVIATGLTTNTFQLSTTTGGSALNTSGSQSGVHSLFKTTSMVFTMLGVSYTYTGGYNTDTLTGIVPALPGSITADTIMMSDVLVHTPKGGDYSTGAKPDILTISRNQIYLADSDKNWVWISNQDNFIQYTYSIPVRTNGEGGSARLDKNVIALVSNNDDNTVRASCGRDLWYPISLVSVTSNGVPGEEVRVGTPAKGVGVGAYNQTAICNTKQGILYLSKDPTFDYLQNIEQNNLVVSTVGEDIESDLQSLDLTRAKTIFWRSVVWLLLPNESKLYGYDMRRKMWQPPQIIAGESLSVIDSQLIVHSSIKNESYVMFSGTNDNGSPIGFRVVPNYFNKNSREQTKMMDGYFVEAKVTPATDTIQFIARLGYKGSKGTLTDLFGSDDGEPFVEEPVSVGGFGAHSIGQMPNGSLYTSDEEVNYKKVRRIFPFIKNGVEFFEMQVEFYCDKLDAQFKILAHGDNAELSTSHNSNLIKI